MDKLPPIEEALAQLEAAPTVQAPQTAPQQAGGVREYPVPSMTQPSASYTAPQIAPTNTTTQVPQQLSAPQAQPSLPPIEEALKTVDTQPQTFDAPLIYYPDQLSAPQMEPVRITQTFGQPSQYDVFSGGINTGVDYATPVGTPVILPQGEWQIEDAFAQADPTGGYIGNGANDGYGNSVVAVNKQTGERLRLSHLSEVNVRPGEVIQGGQVGLTGASGNVTGSHLDAEYYDRSGRISDILKSPYGNIIPHQ